MSLIGGLRFLRRFVTETFRGTRGDRVLIIGAGNAGEMMARELRRLGHEPIGFIDDDESKQGQTIQRTRVLGTAADLGRIVATKRPDEVLIAIPTAGPATIRRFMTEIEQCKVPITTVPTMREILDGRAAAHHVRPVAVEDLLPRAPVTLVTDIDFSAHGEHLLLTFDDGGKSALHIGDELCRRGWRGHFLVTTKLAGTAGFLSRSDIVTLRRAGHLVGSHSHTHPDIFPVLSWPAMCEEWRTSAAILSDWLGERCTLASLPGGDFSKAVGESAAACGFTHFFTSEPRLVPWQEQGCHILGRMFVTTSTRTERVRDAAALRGWQAALARRRCSVMLRSACPPLYRCYVRLRTRPLSVPA